MNEYAGAAALCIKLVVMDYKLMASTFAVVFLAELGDKTQLAALAFAGESKRPLEVFIAASAALVLVTLLGVAAGSWLGDKLPVKTVRIGAALSFLVVGAYLLFRALTEPASA